MCNLSQGIRDEDMELFIMKMHKKNYTLEQIVDVIEDKSVEEVKKIIEKREQDSLIMVDG